MKLTHWGFIRCNVKCTLVRDSPFFTNWHSVSCTLDPLAVGMGMEAWRRDRLIAWGLRYFFATRSSDQRSITRLSSSITLYCSCGQFLITRITAFQAARTTATMSSPTARSIRSSLTVNNLPGRMKLALAIPPIQSENSQSRRIKYLHKDAGNPDKPPNFLTISANRRAGRYLA